MGWGVDGNGTSAGVPSFNVDSSAQVTLNLNQFGDLTRFLISSDLGIDKHMLMQHLCNLHPSII